MEDVFKIGYDSAVERGDISCLAVSRQKGRGIEVVNNFYEKEADDLYKKLTKLIFPAEAGERE